MMEGAHIADTVRSDDPLVIRLSEKSYEAGQWRGMADGLARVIRSHGPFMDDDCRHALAAYDELAAQFDGSEGDQ